MASTINLNSLGKDSEKWTVKIYSLSDPITDEVKYIGKTIYKINDRLKGHLKEAIKNTNNSYKNNWINSLLKNNLQPKIEILDIVEEENWQFWEQWWICIFKGWGYRLTNLTDGGDGIKSKEHQNEIIEKIKYKLSLIENPAKRPEVRKKISEAMKGRVINDEWLKNMSINGKGKKMPNSMKNKRKKAMIGNTIWKDYLKTLTDEEINEVYLIRSKNLSEKYKSGELIHPMLGKTHTDEARKKISEARQGKASWSKKVKQTNLITGEIKIWGSANDINRFYYGKSGDNIAVKIRKNKIYDNSKFEYIKNE